MNKNHILFSLVILFTVGFICGAAELPRKRGYEDGESERPLKKLRLINDEVDQHREYDDEKSEELQMLASKIRDSNIESMTPEVMFLVRGGANPNCRTPGGGSLLRRYVWHDNLEIVALLLEHKANVNSQDYFELGTPLFSAQSVPMLELLLSNGADLGHRNREGESVLHHISFLCRGKPLEILIALCQAGMDANIVNASGKNALNRILWRSLCSSEIRNNEETCLKMAGVLCWYGADRAGINKEWRRPDFNKKVSEFIARLNTLVETFPQKKEEKRALLEAVEADLGSHFDGATVLVDLVTGYLGALELSMKDVNSWESLL